MHSQYVNRTYARTGTLWEGRFKSNLIDDENYLLACHRYIELNPVRAGLVVSPTAYPWSSHRYYTQGIPNQLITEHPVYHSLGIRSGDRRRKFLALFGQSSSEREVALFRDSLNKGRALGSEAFLNRVESLTGIPVRPPKRGRPRKETQISPDSDGQTEMLL